MTTVTFTYAELQDAMKAEFEERMAAIDARTDISLSEKYRLTMEAGYRIACASCELLGSPYRPPRSDWIRR